MFVKIFVVYLSLFLLSVSCKPRRDAASDVAGSVTLGSMPPATGYHFGEYRYLYQYGDRNGTFTNNEWQSMPSTRYSSPGERGFYIAQHPAYNEIYGQQALVAGDSSWLISVDIKSSCRQRENVLLDRDRPEVDSRFESSRALRRSFSSVTRFTNQCRKSGKTSEETKQCEDVHQDFLDEFDIKIVKDTLWADSGFWIIRDPSCITAIKGSPRSALHILGSVSEIWNLSPFTTEKERRQDYGYASSNIMILIRALAELSSWDENELSQILSNVGRSDLPSVKTTVTQVVKKAIDCRQQPATLKPIFDWLITEVTRADALNLKRGGRTFESILSDWRFNLPFQSCDGGRQTPPTNAGKTYRNLVFKKFPDTPVKIECSYSTPTRECENNQRHLGITSSVGTMAEFASESIQIAKWSENRFSGITLDIAEGAATASKSLSLRKKLVQDGLIGIQTKDEVGIDCLFDSIVFDMRFTPEQCRLALRNLDEALSDFQKPATDLRISSITFANANSVESLAEVITLNIDSDATVLKTSLRRRQLLAEKPWFSARFNGVIMRCSMLTSDAECNATMEVVYNIFKENPDLNSKTLRDSWITIDKDRKSDSSSLRLDVADSKYGHLRNIMSFRK